MHLLNDFPPSHIPSPHPFPTSLPHIPSPHPFPISLAHIFNHLMLTPTSSVLLSHMDLQVSSLCPCLQPCSDISMTYSHLPISIAHVPCLHHQPPNADAHLQVSCLFSTHSAASSSDDSFLARFSSRPNTGSSMPCVSNPDLGGMK